MPQGTTTKTASTSRMSSIRLLVSLPKLISAITILPTVSANNANAVGTYASFMLLNLTSPKTLFIKKAFISKRPFLMWLLMLRNTTSFKDPILIWTQPILKVLLAETAISCRGRTHKICFTATAQPRTSLPTHPNSQATKEIINMLSLQINTLEDTFPFEARAHMPINTKRNSPKRTITPISLTNWGQAITGLVIQLMEDFSLSQIPNILRRR